MRIVAVASCLTDFAHAYLAAEQLAQTGRTLGHAIQVETQGRMGIESELSAADIAAADVVIFATRATVLGRERFDAHRAIVEIGLQDAVRDPHAVFAKVAQRLQQETVAV